MELACSLVEAGLLCGALSLRGCEQWKMGGRWRQAGKRRRYEALPCITARALSAVSGNYPLLTRGPLKALRDPGQECEVEALLAPFLGTLRKPKSGLRGQPHCQPGLFQQFVRTRSEN